MKKTAKSIGYNDASEVLLELSKTAAYRELWKYSYISRHIQKTLHEEKQLDEELEKTLNWTCQMIEQYYPAALERLNEGILLEFFNCLIYGYHKKEYNDGYIDLTYEALLSKYDNPIDKTTTKELSDVQRLHALSHKYGYLILELYASPDSTIFWDTFIKFPPDDIFKSSIPPLFKFPEKGNSPKGIQISLQRSNKEIEGNWDFAIYYKDGDKLSQIKNVASNLWDKTGIQSTGNEKNYNIALFIERTACKKTYALNALEQQIFLYDWNKSGRLAPLTNDSNIPADPTQGNPKPKNFSANTIDSFRISEGLTEKSWDPTKNNVRRSIGIHLWDQKNSTTYMNTALKPLIRDTMNELQRNNPSVLNYYHRNYTKLMADKTEINFIHPEEFITTVIREMERDYKLTSKCIDMAMYLSPSESKETT